MARGWVSLLTDFGLSDAFVAVMHGVIVRHDPSLGVIDITHDVHPGDIARGAAVLAESVGYLPVATHVAVIDPGVGTSRRPIALRTPRGLLVGPDNGVLLPAAEVLGGIDAAVALTNAGWHLTPVSATFHGRDIFAPTAARLASGEPFTEAGEPVDPASLMRLPVPVEHLGEGEVEATVHTVDRFGNVQLHVSGDVLSLLDEDVLVLGQTARKVRTFGDAPRGSMVVFTDSSGRAAIAINGGRAVVVLGVEPGDRVRIVNHRSAGVTR